MTKFIAILGLAIIALLSPLVGKAQSVSVFRPSPFKIDKLSTRQDTTHTWVYGEITSNAKKEASTVYILVRWFDKSRRVVAHYTTIVTDLAPGKTLPFRAFAKKNPDIIRYDVAIERVRFAQHQDFPRASLTEAREEEYKALIAPWGDSSFRFLNALVHACWGQRPGYKPMPPGG